MRSRTELMFQVESLICMGLLFGRARENFQRHGITMHR
jgi:hypothetical protein